MSKAAGREDAGQKKVEYSSRVTKNRAQRPGYEIQHRGPVGRVCSDLLFNYFLSKSKVDHHVAGERNGTLGDTKIKCV
jgi:hypothetical protein